MDEHAIPSGLAELEQLHVEPNSEHSTLLHTADDEKLGRAWI